MTTTASSRPQHYERLLPLALPLVCLVWAFWTTLGDLVGAWNSNPQYSHGFLVPGFAAFLLWLRRDKLDPAEIGTGKWHLWIGAGLLAVGIALRLAGTWYFFISLDPFSLMPCVAGIVLLVGGRGAWRWAWPAVLFLVFMIPLPYRVASAMSVPLQRLATVSSTYVMQTFGMPALAEGNVILLNEHEIGIVEACSGLRMLVVFFALSTAVVLVLQRHWVDRAIILASAIPIALVSNILRVTTTGMMYEAGYGEMANHYFHDVAGWLMMPLALGMLWVEVAVLSRLFIDEPINPGRVPPPSLRRPAGPHSRPNLPRTRQQAPTTQLARDNEPRPRTRLAVEPTADKS
jgi:exosortase